MSDFKIACDYTIDRNEGTEYTDRPDDDGGPTKFGITLATLRQWDLMRGVANTQPSDVEVLTRDEAEQIYQEFFWKALALDRVTAQAPATAIFDLAVNLGERNAVIVAQRALGVRVDGVLGSITISKIEVLDSKHFIPLLIEQAAGYYAERVQLKPSNLSNLKGWIARAVRLLELI